MTRPDVEGVHLNVGLGGEVALREPQLGALGTGDLTLERDLEGHDHIRILRVAADRLVDRAPNDSVTDTRDQETRVDAARSGLRVRTRIVELDRILDRRRIERPLGSLEHLADERGVVVEGDPDVDTVVGGEDRLSDQVRTRDRKRVAVDRRRAFEVDRDGLEELIFTLDALVSEKPATSVAPLDAGDLSGEVVVGRGRRPDLRYRTRPRSRSRPSRRPSRCSSDA